MEKIMDSRASRLVFKAACPVDDNYYSMIFLVLKHFLYKVQMNLYIFPVRENRYQDKIDDFQRFNRPLVGIAAEIKNNRPVVIQLWQCFISVQNQILIIRQYLINDAQTVIRYQAVAMRQGKIQGYSRLAHAALGVKNHQATDFFRQCFHFLLKYNVILLNTIHHNITLYFKVFNN